MTGRADGRSEGVLRRAVVVVEEAEVVVVFVVWRVEEEFEEGEG
jgi:hypothetical protein